MLAAGSAAAQPACEPWCTEPCHVLNGDVERECSGCTAAGGARCYPGAAGYDTWEERARAYQQQQQQQQQQGSLARAPERTQASEPGARLYPECDTLRCRRVRQKLELEAAQQAERMVQVLPSPPPQQRTRAPPLPTTSQLPQRRRKPVGLGTRHDGRSAGGVEVQCELQRLSRSQLLAMTPAERATVLEKPAVITGLIDDWPAFRPDGGWASPRNFSARFGHHRFLAKRVRFGWDRAHEHGVDHGLTSVSVAELVQNTRTEHIIVLDEEHRAESEEALLQDLQTEYRNPDIFEAASQVRVFSFGGGHRGVQMMQHGVAWLGLVTGAKLWHLAHPDLPKPQDRDCQTLPGGGMIDYGLAKQEGVTHCLLLPGETVFVPDAWWHATCNLDPYTIGVGGQLWRHGMDNLFETAEERTVPVRYEPSFGPEALVKATPLPDVIEPIVFDPEQEEAEEEAEVGARPEGPGLVPGSQVKRVAVSSARGGTELL